MGVRFIVGITDVINISVLPTLYFTMQYVACYLMRTRVTEDDEQLKQEKGDLHKLCQSGGNCFDWVREHDWRVLFGSSHCFASPGVF